MWKKILIGFTVSVGVILLIIILIGVLVDVEDGESATTDTKPTSTAEPTSTKTPVGLGVSRDSVEDAFSGFDLEDAPLNDGRERLLGGSPDDVILLELIGDSSKLEEAALIMTVNAGANDAIPGYAQRFLSAVLPDWPGGLDWFEQGVIELADRSEQNVEMETSHGDAVITLSANKQFGWLTIDIEPAQGEPQAQNSTATPEPTPTLTPPASFATHIAQQNARPTIAPTRPAHSLDVTRQPTSTSQPTPIPEIQGRQWLGDRQTLMVGGTGEDGLSPGKYEYRDDNGGTIVNGYDCHLFINGKGTKVELKYGKPFTITLKPRNKQVELDAGRYRDGCTGAWSKIGFGLYRIGS